MPKQLLTVEGTQVAVVNRDGEDYISLTDMVRENENGASVIDNWLRNKNTLEFLSVWETMYNPTFNSLEFEGIKSEAGLNRFAISIKQWIAKTNATGLTAKAGRYGGTFAHRDIAFEFASWISPKFKLYRIVVLSNLESINAELIRQALTQAERLRALNATAIAQLRSLVSSKVIKKLKKND